MKKATALTISMAIAVFLWGFAFLSREVLLWDFTPFEIIFYRLLAAFLLLSLFSLLTPKTAPDLPRIACLQAAFLLALFVLSENAALELLPLSNYWLTLILLPLGFTLQAFSRNRTGSMLFFCAWLCAFLGLFLILSGGALLWLWSAEGLFYALAAACALTLFSFKLKKYTGTKFDPLRSARTICGYTLLLLLPGIILTPSFWDPALFNDYANRLNVFYQGLTMSLLLPAWLLSVTCLGIRRTAFLLFLAPLGFFFASASFLNAEFSFNVVTGICLILLGLRLAFTEDH